MVNFFSKILAFLVWIASLVLVAGCQAQARSDPVLPVEIALTPLAPVEASGHQVETGNPDNPYGPFPYETVDDFGKAKSGKLSGVVFYPPRETLLAVSDEGHMIEIKTDGTLVQKKLVRKKADFEGITYSPVTGMLYVAIEGKEIILEVNPETLEAERDRPIDRLFEGDVLFSPEGNGIEGITFVPAADGATEGSFYLVNQSDELGGTDPSIVFEVEIDYGAGEPQARIIRYFSVGVTDLSGIHYEPSSRRLLIVSDDNNLLLEVSLTGQVLEAYLLPGEKQEGITVDKAGSLYIAQDTKDALVKFSSLDRAGDPGE